MFTAAFAHELRTPLAVLKGRLHGLEDGVIEPASGECGRLLAQVDKLLHVVDSLGALTNARSGELCMDWRKADLAEILLPAMDGIRQQAETDGIELRTSYDHVDVACDPARFSQALTSLARAIIFDLPPGSQFDVQLTARPDGAVLSLASANWKQEGHTGAVPLGAWISSNGSVSGRSWASLDAALAAALLDAHGWPVTVSSGLAGEGMAVLIRIPLCR